MSPGLQSEKGECNNFYKGKLYFSNEDKRLKEKKNDFRFSKSGKLNYACSKQGSYINFLH